MESRRDACTCDETVSLNREVAALLAHVPPWLREAAGSVAEDDLLEIVMDLGRPPRLRLRTGWLDLEREVTRDDLQYVVGRLDRFRPDNRTGIDRTLHRIACIRDRYQDIVGYTFRVGRAVVGAAAPVRELLASGASLLIVGPPGSGKTTVLRDAARILDEVGRAVVVCDTSNEIGGDGQVPHPAIGRSRRLQVPSPEAQPRVLLEALVNHWPDVLVVDEIGYRGDAEVVATIARRAAFKPSGRNGWHDDITHLLLECFCIDLVNAGNERGVWNPVRHPVKNVPSVLMALSIDPRGVWQPEQSRL